MGAERIADKKNRGVALATALMLSVLILVLGITLLTTSQHDLYFQRQQQARDRADVLARSGLEYSFYLFKQIPSTLDSTLPVNIPQPYPVLGTTERFVLDRKQDSVSGRIALVILGEVLNSQGDILAKRTIIIPYGPDDVLTEAEFETQAYSPEL